MFCCNLPPTTQAEWPRPLTCHCENTGVERTPNKTQRRQTTLEKKILPPLLPGLKLATFRAWVWRFTNKLSQLPIGNMASYELFITCFINILMLSKPKEKGRQTSHNETLTIIRPCFPKHRIAQQKPNVQQLAPTSLRGMGYFCLLYFSHLLQKAAHVECLGCHGNILTCQKFSHQLKNKNHDSRKWRKDTFLLRILLCLFLVDPRQPDEELWKQNWRTWTTCGAPSRGWPATDRDGGALLLPYMSAGVTGSNEMNVSVFLGFSLFVFFFVLESNSVLSDVHHPYQTTAYHHTTTITNCLMLIVSV